MGFTQIFRKKNHEKVENLALLPFAREFDPLRHRNKLLTIQRLEDNCTPFIVRKATASNSRWEVTAFDHFPLEEEVRDAVYEDYGGGKYDVFGGGTLLKSYQFPGESRGFVGGQGTSRGKPRGFKSNIENKAAEAFDEILEANPELKEGLMRGILSKHFGYLISGRTLELSLE